MANPDRLSGLDASFLAVERGGAHMHVGSVMLFAGDSPPYEELVSKLEARLDLVPRYRQKVAFVPLDAGRPVWIDDPHFNVGYHVRHSALPSPAGVPELKRLAARVFAQRLDRSKPLWEIWLVDRVDDDKHALVCKTHHCLVDGVSGVDITTVLFDLEPDPPRVEPQAGGTNWFPRPEPSRASLLADALAERATAPLGAVRAAAAAISDPGEVAQRAATAIAGAAGVAAASLGSAPASPLNVPIGPHRRFTWVSADLARFKAIKDALRGTINDVVLAAVTGALRAFYIEEGYPTDDVTLKAMVPMSTRADAERGALGNRVTTMYAPLPLHEPDAARRFDLIHDAMAGLKESGQAVGAEVLTKLTDFAPPTVLAQASRLQSRQRLYNLTVTNVPGPQLPLYLNGNLLLAMHPQVPLVANTALGIAIMSYNGGLNFGLLGDYDALPDVEMIAEGLEAAIDELAGLAGLGSGDGARPGKARTPVA